jgi:hypothetical protein
MGKGSANTAVVEVDDVFAMAQEKPSDTLSRRAL